MVHFDTNHFFMSNIATWFLSYDVMHVLHSYYISVVLAPQNHFSLVLVLVLYFEIILVSISSSILSSQ